MRKLFFGLMPITILAAISLAVIAMSFDPFSSDNFIKFLFFASLATFIWGCGAIVFYVLNLFSDDRSTDSLRRGFFLALLALALVLLKKQGLLYLYTGFLTALIIMLIEVWIYKIGKLTTTSSGQDNL